jgi:hypothetical protein
MVGGMTDIDALKRDINLRRFATAHGFFEDKKERWAGHECFRNIAGEKLYIHQLADGRWMYWNPKSSEGGSVIDFYIKYGGARDAKDAINGLHEWRIIAPVNGDYRTQSDANEETAQQVKKDRLAVQEAFAAMKGVTRNSYLERERGIPAMVLRDWRFAGRVFTDHRNNVIVKAISYAALEDDGHTRYASTGGIISKAQFELLLAEFDRMPRGSEFLSGTDADEAGRRMTRNVQRAFHATGREVMVRSIEPVSGKDWNNVLLADQSARVARMRTLIPA